jgi:hypothetical protein
VLQFDDKFVKNTCEFNLLPAFSAAGTRADGVELIVGMLAFGAIGGAVIGGVIVIIPIHFIFGRKAATGERP